MKRIPPEILEKGRVRDGQYGSTFGAMYGAFDISGPCGRLRILSSGVDAKAGWEHVSVSCRDRVPYWEEMVFVKHLFWNPNECVVQYHPAQDEYVNHHPYCLHLWKPLRHHLPTPPALLVGPKS